MSKRESFGIYRRNLLHIDVIIADLFRNQAAKIESVKANYRKWLESNRMEPKRYRNNRKRPHPGAPYTPEFVTG